MSGPPWLRVEKAARGWYIFAIDGQGSPVYSLTKGPFKTKEEAENALYARTVPRGV